MITGNTAVLPFNTFFCQNYDYLRGFANLIDSRCDADNLLHDSYLKCRQRIYYSGYSGSTYLNFIRVTMTNTLRSKIRDRKDLVTMDYGSTHYDMEDTCDSNTNDFAPEAEEKLLVAEQQETLLKEMEAQYILKNAYVYEYVNKYFSPKEEMIFKTYYVLRHKHLNYKQLSAAVNLSMTTVSKTIKKIKKELRYNLQSYINTGYNVMELQQLLTKVEALLKTDVRANQQNYRETYHQVFGKHWSGCTCNLSTLKASLRAWYDKNKLI